MRMDGLSAWAVRLFMQVMAEVVPSARVDFLCCGEPETSAAALREFVRAQRWRAWK